MTPEEKIKIAGYADVTPLNDRTYEAALVGVSVDRRAVYDYDKMVECLERKEGFTREQAVAWLEYNTLRSIEYMGKHSPLVVRLL